MAEILKRIFFKLCKIDTLFKIYDSYKNGINPAVVAILIKINNFEVNNKM